MRVISSAIVLGIGFLMVSGSPARAQLGEMGEAVKKGAADAAKQEVMKGVGEQLGLPTATPPVTPTPETGATGTPAGEVTPGTADTPAAAPGAEKGAAAAPAGEPKAAPGEAEAPAAAPGAEKGAAAAPVGEPKVAPAETPAGMPGAAGTVQDVGEGMMKKKMPKMP